MRKIKYTCIAVMLLVSSAFIFTGCKGDNSSSTAATTASAETEEGASTISADHAYRIAIKEFLDKKNVSEIVDYRVTVSGDCWVVYLTGTPEGEKEAIAYNFFVNAYTSNVDDMKETEIIIRETE